MVGVRARSHLHTPIEREAGMQDGAMTIALLIRHAHTDAIGRWLPGRMRGVHLSAAGREQAARLGRSLAATPLSAIHSSPLERARETADEIARHHALPLQLHDALSEVDFGEWTGQTFDELDADPRWRLFNLQRGSAAVPEGETAPAVQRRIVRAVERLAKRHRGETFAVVSHADVLRAAVLHYTNTP